MPGQQLITVEIIAMTVIIIGAFWMLFNRTFAPWIQQREQQARRDEMIENRLNAIDVKLDEWKSSKDHIYQQFEKQNQRFDEMNKRIDATNTELSKLSAQIIARLFSVTERND